MTFAAVGSFLQATTGAPATSLNITLNNQGIGDLILMAVRSTTNGIVPSSITGGGATWSQIGTTFTGTTNAGVWAIFQGTVTATGAQTATANLTGGSANIRADGGEFSSTVGSWALDVQTHLDGAGVSTWPSITPAGAGELYFGSSQDSGAASAGATSGYTYNIDANSNGTAWNAACTGAAQAPVWGDAGHIFGVMILVQETGSAAPVVVTPAQPGRTWRQKFQHPQQLPVVPVAATGATVSGDVAVAATATITATATVTALGAATVSTAAAITASATDTVLGAAAATTTATITAAATDTALAAAAVATTATITAAITETDSAAAAVASTATITAAMTATELAAAALAVTATITATITVGGTVVSGDVVLSAAATITAAATGIRSAAAAVSSTATMTASATGIRSAAAAVAETATITAAGTSTVRGAASVGTTATITATATIPVAFTIGVLTGTTSAASALTAATASNALTASTAAASAITATTTRTGGPS